MDVAKCKEAEKENASLPPTGAGLSCSQDGAEMDAAAKAAFESACQALVCVPHILIADVGEMVAQSIRANRETAAVDLRNMLETLFEADEPFANLVADVVEQWKEKQLRETKRTPMIGTIADISGGMLEKMLVEAGANFVDATPDEQRPIQTIAIEK